MLYFDFHLLLIKIIFEIKELQQYMVVSYMYVFMYCNWGDLLQGFHLFAKILKGIVGLSRDLNPGPPAPKAGIMPLDHWAGLSTL